MVVSGACELVVVVVVVNGELVVEIVVVGCAVVGANVVVVVVDAVVVVVVVVVVVLGLLKPVALPGCLRCVGGGIKAEDGGGAFGLVIGCIIADDDESITARPTPSSPGAPPTPGKSAPTSGVSA